MMHGQKNIKRDVKSGLPNIVGIWLLSTKMARVIILLSRFWELAE